MIAKIKGIVDSIFEDHIYITVSVGVSYIVFCSKKLIKQLHLKSDLELFIYSYIREDKFELYGFLSLQEKEIFLLLNSVKGVGNRVALSILSQYNSHDIEKAVTTKNKDLFLNVVGIGHKVAERILIELKNKIFAIVNSNTSQGEENFESNNNGGALIQDALEALISLGLNRKDTYFKLKKIYMQNPTIELDNLIKKCLKK